MPATIRAAGGSDCRRFSACAIIKPEILNPNCSFAAGPGTDRKFDCSQLTQCPSASRAPRKSDIAALQPQPVALGLKIERVVLPAPDIPAARVRQFEFEIIPWSLSSNAEGKGKCLGQSGSELLSSHHKTSALLEIKIQSQRRAIVPGLAGELQGSMTRGNCLPLLRLGKIVHDSRFHDDRTRIPSMHLTFLTPIKFGQGRR